MSSPFGLSDDSPVYVISVAAQLAGLHPQTLRYYDKLGLVSPGRSSGRGRRYSLRDVLALREIQRLSQEEGINLSGIKRILELQGDLRRQVGPLANLEDTGLGADIPVLFHVTSGLPHKPNRPYIGGPAAASI